MSITDKISKMINKEYKIFSEEDYDYYGWFLKHDFITINRYENESDAKKAARAMVENKVVTQAEVKPVTVFKEDAAGEVCEALCYDMIFDGRDIYYYKDTDDHPSDEEYYSALNVYIHIVSTNLRPKLRRIKWF